MFEIIRDKTFAHLFATLRTLSFIEKRFKASLSETKLEPACHYRI